MLGCWHFLKVIRCPGREPDAECMQSDLANHHQISVKAARLIVKKLNGTQPRPLDGSRTRLDGSSRPECRFPPAHQIFFDLREICNPTDVIKWTSLSRREKRQV